MTLPIQQPVNKNIPGWDALPNHVKQRFEDAFSKNAKVITLLKQAEQAKKSGNFLIAMNVYKKLEEARLNAQHTLMNNEDHEVEKVTLLEMGLSLPDLERINVLTIAMYMACDMIEFFAIEINSILKKQDPSARFEMFDPIRKVGEEAKNNLRYLWKNTRMYETEVFNDNSDDMREMLVNKAKKVYKKYSKHVNESNRIAKEEK